MQMAAKKTTNRASNPTISVSLRIDPKTKYLIDLLAREQKRTITGVIEWAVESAAGQLDFHHNPHGDNALSFLDEIGELWSTDEAVRLVRLAIKKPSLLDYDEMRLWETIKASGGFWRARHHNYISEDHLDMGLIQKHWDGLLDHVSRHRSNRSIVPYDLPGEGRGAKEIPDDPFGSELPF